MGSMIERVAENIAVSLGEGGHYRAPAFIEAARAAILAMREPTDSMIAKADGEYRDDDRKALIGEWQTMIDAALSE